MTDTPAWFEDEFEPRPRRRLVVIGGAVAVAWAVVAVLVLLLGGSRPDEHRHAGSAAPDAGAVDPAGTDGATGVPAPQARSAADEDRLEVGPGAPTAPSDPSDPVSDGAGAPPGSAEAMVSRDAAEAVAVAVARAWLSDGGPDLMITGVEVDQRAYLEHVTVEGFDLAGSELAVARLHLVLLLREGDHYTEVVLRRAAVPLTLTPGRVDPAGQPWFLPGVPELETTPPGTTAVDDDEILDEVAQVLVEAGYLHPEVREVTTTADGSIAAQVHTMTPEGDLVDGVVWLAYAPDGLVLLGRDR